MNNKESLVFIPKQDTVVLEGKFSSAKQQDDTLEEKVHDTTLSFLSAAMKESRERKFGNATSQHFTTVFHRSVYVELSKMLVALRDDDYEGKTGIFTKILLGPRGIAKTTCLRNFVSATPFLVPSVASLFVSYTSEGALPHELISGAVTSLCHRISKSFGWDTSRDEDETFPDYVVRNLTENNTRLVLVVDEVDQLFKASDSEPIFFEFARKSLSELATLGNNRCGRLMIVLSGSSSRLRSFIKGSSTEFSAEEKHDFKMLSRNLNMNNHRYKTLHVTYPRPDSLPDALAILHPCKDLFSKSIDKFEEKLVEKARRMMFDRGCNPRALDDPNETNSECVVPLDHSCHRLWMQLLVLWFGYPSNRKLLAVLGKRKQTWRDLIHYRERWSPYLCDDCSREKKVCLHATAKFKWENGFKPISMSTMYHSRGPELAYQLDKLQYEGYLIVIEGNIFPASLGLYVENLASWATSLSQLLRRKCTLFCTTPQDQLDLLDDLSTTARELVKEALRSGISSK